MGGQRSEGRYGGRADDVGGMERQIETARQRRGKRKRENLKILTSEVIQSHKTTF